MKKIKLYYMRGRGRDDEAQKNFGDYLSPLIVEAVSAKPVEYSPAKSADLLAIGSIINRANKSRKWGFLKRPMHIWGTGAGSETVLSPVKHYVHAVRGPMTEAKIPCASASIPYGDPGLLADLIVKKPKNKKFFLGIIPHYVDKTKPLFKSLQQNFPDAKVIDVFDEVHSVLEQIASCEFILSSSLHGLIIADAFGVPNKRVKCDEFLEDYKYQDYLKSHGVEDFTWLTNEAQAKKEFFEEEIGRYARPNLDSLKDGLMKSFPQSI